MTHDVFVSHSSGDKVVADAVCTALEARGIRCWVAHRDIRLGEIWARAVVDAIDASRVLVLVFSSQANRSPQVLREVAEAVDRAIPIITLRFEAVPPSREMGYYIKAVQWLDALTRPLEPHLQRLADRVQELLAEGSTETAGPAPTVEAPESVETVEAVGRRDVVVSEVEAEAATAQELAPGLQAADSDGQAVDIERAQTVAPVAEQREVTQPRRLVAAIPSVRAAGALVLVVVAVLAGRAWLWPLLPSVFEPSPSATATTRPTQTATGLAAQVPIGSRPTATRAAAPSSTPALKAGATKVLQPSEITLVYVPAGEFLMGSADSDTDAQSDEKPQHAVVLDAYWIGQTEVTNAQYRRFIEAGGYGTRAYWSDAGWAWKEGKGVTQPGNWNDPQWNGAEYPVVGLNWYEAEAFARWAEARLPTEAEWEYAARGGPVSLGYKYAGSNSVDEVAWYSSNSGGRTHPAAGKKANELVLYDMSGNVWEWVADWWDPGYYASSPRENPNGPASGQHRLVRGGSWGYRQVFARSAFRFRLVPGYRDGFLGFRVAE